MKNRSKIFLLVPLLLICLALASILIFTHPIQIDSWDSPFRIVSKMKGRYWTTKDGIHFFVYSLEITVRDTAPYKGRQTIEAISLVLAKTWEHSSRKNAWEKAESGSAKVIDITLNCGESMRLRNLYFLIPFDGPSVLSDRWALIEVKGRAIDSKRRSQTAGFSYAHSKRDIFSESGNEVPTLPQKSDTTEF